jgi:hypothetical protein
MNSDSPISAHSTQNLASLRIEFQQVFFYVGKKLFNVACLSPSSDQLQQICLACFQGGRSPAFSLLSSPVLPLDFPLSSLGFCMAFSVRNKLSNIVNSSLQFLND